MSNAITPEYVYKLPLWAIALLIATSFSPPALAVGVAVSIRGTGPSPVDIAWGVATLLSALLAGWFLSRVRIVLGPEGIWFPLSRSQLLWEDVLERALRRGIGMQWVEVTDRKGKVFRILLTRPGGREFRERLLASLDLDGEEQAGIS